MKHFLLCALIICNTMQAQNIKTEDQQDLATALSEQADTSMDISDDLGDLDAYFNANPIEQHEPTWFENKGRDIAGHILNIPGALWLLIRLAGAYNWGHNLIYPEVQEQSDNTDNQKLEPEHDDNWL